MQTYEYEQLRDRSPRSPPSSPDDETLLTAVQTRARYGGISSMGLWRWRRNPRMRFPQPVIINGRVYFRLGALRAWEAERAAEEQKAP